MNENDISDMIMSAIEADQKPPAEFVKAVMTNEIQLPDAIMMALVEKGWIPRTKCEVWTRVMGYFRPVSQFNVGKKAEFAERVLPKISDIKTITES